MIRNQALRADNSPKDKTIYYCIGFISKMSAFLFTSFYGYDQFNWFLYKIKTTILYDSCFVESGNFTQSGCTL